MPSRLTLAGFIGATVFFFIMLDLTTEWSFLARVAFSCTGAVAGMKAGWLVASIPDAFRRKEHD